MRNVLLGILVCFSTGAMATPVNDSVSEFYDTHKGYHCDYFGSVLDDLAQKGWKYVSSQDHDIYDRQTFKRGNETIIVDVGSQSACIIQKYRDGHPLLHRS